MNIGLMREVAAGGILAGCHPPSNPKVLGEGLRGGIQRPPLYSSAWRSCLRALSSSATAGSLGLGRLNSVSLQCVWGAGSRGEGPREGQGWTLGTYSVPGLAGDSLERLASLNCLSSSLFTLPAWVRDQ